MSIPSSDRNSSRQKARVTQSLPSVALGEVGLDHGPVAALSQRFEGDGSVAGVDGPGVPAAVDEQGHQGVDGMEHQLPEPLPIHDHPVVVPVGEQLVGQPADVDV